MNKPAILTAALLTAIGISILAYKVVAFGFPIVADKETKLWTIEASINYEARQDKSPTIQLRIPEKSGSHEILEENMIGAGYGRIIKKDPVGRVSRWTKRNVTGTDEVYYRAVVSNVDRQDLPKAAVQVSTKNLQDPTIKNLLEEVSARSADDESFVSELMKRFASYESNENLQAILGLNPSQADLARLAVSLLNTKGIPANLARGIELVAEQSDSPLITWIEVFYGEKWNLFTPSGKEISSVNKYFLWWRGQSAPVKVKNGKLNDVQFSVYEDQSLQLIEAINRFKEQNPLFYKLSLFNLPVKTQAVYKVLLLLPIGALVVVFLRTVVGLFSFGNFIPVLIAISFRETYLVWGLVLFSVVTLIGLVARLFLERLSLLTSARLSIVVSAVVLGMGALSLLLQELNAVRGLSVALFPMVVLTMIIERMSIVWEEVGPTEAAIQGLQTLLVSVIVYAFITIGVVSDLVFIFPETILVVIAALIMLGRYTGYRLSELIRFNDLAKA